MTNARRQARLLMQLLTVPAPWSITDLCAQVAIIRGRELIVEAADTNLATATVRREAHRDVITYRRDHHNPDHVIAHELAHLLAGDLDGPADLSDGVDADVAGAARIMMRDCAYGSFREQVAESFAGLVMERARQHTRDAGVSAGGARMLNGFGEAMR